MSKDEKSSWIFVLWASSVLAAFGLGFSVKYPYFLIAFGTTFIVLFVVWLFRITYLAGAKR